MASLSAEDYECVLCLRLLYEPCTLRCGHSFCVRCCHDLAKARHAKCPTCRRVLPLHGQPSDMAVSRELGRLLADVFPEAYAARQAEDKAEAALRDEAEASRAASSPSQSSSASASAEPEATLPLFYLDSMLPRQRLQLNIFEPRYRLMVRRCLEGSRRFGMIGVEWQTPLRHMGQGGLRHGVEVEIVENAPQTDGRFHIEVLASRRFETVGGTWEQDGYAMANVRWMLPPSAAAAAAAAAPATPATPTTEAAAEAAAEAVTEADAGADAGAAAETPSARSARGSSSTGGSGTVDASESESPETSNDAAAAAAADRSSGDSDATCLELAAALEPLVEEWKQLVATGRWERFRGQLGRSLADLGAKKPAFLSHFCKTRMFVPRQARDNHRKS
jgi:Lon protease-like protein